MPIDETPKFKTLDRDPSNLRSACDGCHAAKIRCTGETPCARCARENLQCHYSNKAKIGKPRGSMNKKTIERLQQSKLAKERNRTAPTPPSTACGDTRSTSPRAPTTSPPNRARDPTFNIAQSPPNTIETLDTPSFPSFTFGFSSSEALTMPGDEPDRIDWLPVMADNFMQHGCVRAVDRSTPLHTQSIGRGLSSEMSEDNGNDPIFWCEIPASDKPSRVESASPLFPPYSPTSTMTHTFETQANTCMLPAHSGSSLLNTSCSNSSSCTCFSTLSNHLCALQVTSPTSRQTRAIDILLIQSQRIIPSITSLFDCQYCMKETQSLFLVSMILSRLLRWSQVSIHAHGSRCVPAQVHLGRYHTSSEFGATVTRMLIQTHCMCLKTTVEAFQHEVGRIGCEDAERAYLTLQARNFQQEFEKLIEELPNVPSAIPG